MLNDFKKNSLGYRLLIPGLLIILLINIIPIIQGIYYSFTDYSLVQGEINFIGLKNYITAFTSDREFYNVLTFTFIYSFATVVISYILGLLMATILNQKIRFRVFFRALVLLPWVIPIVVAAITWSWVLDYHYGIVNQVLVNLRLIDSPILFLADRTIARFTVIMVTSWKSFPFMTVVLLAGLQSIPKDLYEAASIDGADAFRNFWHITMPHLKGISLIITMLTFIWTFNSFEYIWLLTAGGPARSTFVLPIYTYHRAFFRGDIGYASTIGTIMLIVLLLLSYFYLNLQKEKVTKK
jgi:multiple sugar transport system permease protein